MNIKDDLKEKLRALALAVSDNFCYSCYRVVKADHCPGCCSDDFMRHLEGVGVEYGTDWIIEHLIEQNCDPIDQDEHYKELLNETCATIKIGSLEFDPGQALQLLDPTAFTIGAGEVFDDQDQYSEIDGEYYQNSDIENMISELSQ